MPHTTDKQSLTKTIIRLSSQLLSVVKLSGIPIIKHLNVHISGVFWLIFAYFAVLGVL